MKKTRRKIPGVIALSLVVATLMVMASGIASAAGVSVLTATPAGQSIHGKINMSEITGEIAEPPQLTSAASAVAKEKQWYEYVYYSPEPVGYYYHNETTRMAYYDPYDYANSLVMEVNDTITDWSSMNTLQVSYTTKDSITDTSGTSAETVTTVEPEYSKTTTTETEEYTVRTVVSNQTDSYNTSKTVTDDNSQQWDAGADIKIGKDTWPVKVDVGGGVTWTTGTVETRIESTDGSGRTGYTVSTDDTTVTTGPTTTTVTEKIDRKMVTATGHSTNSSIELSSENSTTITKTYDAAYFSANGSPLQWKIVQYTVKMPMKCQIEFLVDGEWIHGEYNYCMLNTIQGTCRAWLQNSVAYYEHWGDGSPVTWNEFWSQFFTEESLTQAYQNRLYPEY